MVVSPCRTSGLVVRGRLGCRGRGDTGRGGCLRLLLVTSLSTASDFELSSAVVSQVMSLVRSLLSLFGSK